MFTNIPYDYNSTAGSESWVKEPARMFNKVAEIANENNIPFINYNDKLTDIGFDFKSDMHNSSHVNIWGANKITVYLGEFLKENYSLIDHRHDSNYAQWTIDYKRSQVASLFAQ